MTVFPAPVVAGSVQDHQVAPDLHGGVTLPRQGLGMENAAVWREVVHEGHEIAGPGRHLRMGLAEPCVVAQNSFALRQSVLALGVSQFPVPSLAAALAQELTDGGREPPARLRCPRDLQYRRILITENQ